MKKLEIISLVIVVVLFGLSTSLLIGFGLEELMETIESIGKKNLNDDGIFFGLPVLFPAIFSLVYLIISVKLWFRKAGYNKLILSSYVINILTIAITIAGFLTLIATGDGLAIAVILPIAGGIIATLLIASFVLLSIGSSRLKSIT